MISGNNRASVIGIKALLLERWGGTSNSNGARSGITRRMSSEGPRRRRRSPNSSPAEVDLFREISEAHTAARDAIGSDWLLRPSSWSLQQGTPERERQVRRRTTKSWVPNVIPRGDNRRLCRKLGNSGRSTPYKQPTPSLIQESPALWTRVHRLIVDGTPPSHMTPVHPSRIT